MADLPLGVSRSLTGFEGSIAGARLIVDFPALDSEAALLDEATGQLDTANTRLDSVLDQLDSLSSAPEELGALIQDVKEQVEVLIKPDLKLQTDLLRETAEQVRFFRSRMNTVELAHVAMIFQSVFQNALAFNPTYESPDEVVEEKMQKVKITLLVGPGAGVKLGAKVDIHVGAQASVDVTLQEHLKELQDGTVEVTYLDGVGVGAELGGTALAGDLEAGSLGITVHGGIAAAVTYSLPKEDLNKLRVWVAAGAYDSTRRLRGDHPGTEMSTTVERSGSGALAAAVGRDRGKHSFSVDAEMVATKKTIKHDGSGYQKGDTQTTITLSASSSAAFRKALNQDFSTDEGSSYAVSFVDDKDGNRKSIQISESKAVSTSASMTREGESVSKDDKKTKKTTSVGADVSRIETTSSRVDFVDNPAMRDVWNIEYAKAMGGSMSELAALIEIDKLIRTYGVRTGPSVSKVTSTGVSGGASAGVGVTIEVKGSEFTEITKGEVTTPLDHLEEAKKAYMAGPYAGG